MKLKLNWHKSQNFGDQLAPYIVNRLWKTDVEHVNDSLIDSPHLMLLGSILNEATHNTTVLGAGIVSNLKEFSDS